MNAGSFTLITAGVFRVPKGELSSRLSHIFRCIQELAAEYHPDIAACEKVFANVNPQSTLLLGQARGAAINVPMVLYGVTIVSAATQP